MLNICVNMRKEDSLFQECLRTFMEVSFLGMAFVDRLEAETKGASIDIVRHVPKCRGPQSRTRNLTSAPHVDAYGFRGPNPKVLFLSPYEFSMYYRVVRVPEPFRSNCNMWSAWTEEGEKYYEDNKHSDSFRLIPGKHYKVNADFVEVWRANVTTHTCVIYIYIHTYFCFLQTE